MVLLFSFVSFGGNVSTFFSKKGFRLPYLGVGPGFIVIVEIIRG